VRCGHSYKLMGSPAKNWSKLLIRAFSRKGMKALALCKIGRVALGGPPQISYWRRPLGVAFLFISRVTCAFIGSITLAVTFCNNTRTSSACMLSSPNCLRQ
jgi:hypothetical protein